jgi:hypothetical protein
VIRGLVLGTDDSPLAGVYARASFPRGQAFFAGPPTDATGRFGITVRLDLAPQSPDTLRGWARVAKPGSPSDTVVVDSTTVLVQLRPRTAPPLVTEVVVRLALAP